MAELLRGGGFQVRVIANGAAAVCSGAVQRSLAFVYLLLSDPPEFTENCEHRQ